MKTYLVSEELLRRVLDALHQFQNRESMDDLESFGYAADTCEEALRALLAKPPSEPVAYTNETTLTKLAACEKSRAMWITKSALTEKDLQEQLAAMTKERDSMKLDAAIGRVPMDSKDFAWEDKLAAVEKERDDWKALSQRLLVEYEQRMAQLAACNEEWKDETRKANHLYSALIATQDQLAACEAKMKETVATLNGNLDHCIQELCDSQERERQLRGALEKTSKARGCELIAQAALNLPTPPLR
jgi:hypothetical protein